MSCVRRGRSTGASAETMSTSAISPSPVRGVVSIASPTWAPSAIEVSASLSGPRRVGEPDRRSRIASSRALRSAVPADWLSASANSAKGLRVLVVCGSHFSQSSCCDQAGSTIAVTMSSFGAWSPNSCTPTPRTTSAARWTGPAMPSAPELGSSSTIGTSSTCSNLLRSFATCRWYRAIPVSIADDSWIELRLAARPTPSRSARKFQCSGRRVHSSGPSRIACS